MFPVWKRDPSACSEAVGCSGVFARHTLDAEEADPDERRERDLVVVIRSCWIFAKAGREFVHAPPQRFINFPEEAYWHTHDFFFPALYGIERYRVISQSTNITLVHARKWIIPSLSEVGLCLCTSSAFGDPSL